MLCQKCNKNQATVRYAEVVDGKVADQHLCHECMLKQETRDTTGFKLSAPKAMRRPGMRPVVDRESVKRACPACGITLMEVVASGQAGCTRCYEVFSDALEPVLSSIHDMPAAVRHRGKVPQKDDVRERFHAELRTKRALLRSALKAENYEEAAALRDEIRAMEARVGHVEERPSVAIGQES